MAATTFGIIDAGVRNSENNRLSAVRLGQAAGKAAAPVRLNPADPQSGRPRPAPPSAFCQVDFVWWHRFPRQPRRPIRTDCLGRDCERTARRRTGLRRRPDALHRIEEHRLESEPVPQRRRTAMGRQSRNHRKTAEYHGFTYTTKTSHRHTSHATTRARGPNPKSQAETGTSPYPNLSAPGPPTTAPPQNRRIPSICLLSYNLQPPNQLPSPPKLQTEPENTS